MCLVIPLCIIICRSICSKSSLHLALTFLFDPTFVDYLWKVFSPDSNQLSRVKEGRIPHWNTAVLTMRYCFTKSIETRNTPSWEKHDMKFLFLHPFRPTHRTSVVRLLVSFPRRLNWCSRDAEHAPDTRDSMPSAGIVLLCTRLGRFYRGRAVLYFATLGKILSMLAVVIPPVSGTLVLCSTTLRGGYTICDSAKICSLVLIIPLAFLIVSKITNHCHCRSE